jgi:hypothetical protein
VLEALAELEMLEETELEPLLDFIIDKLLIDDVDGVLDIDL